jgi:hypothetical protein
MAFFNRVTNIPFAHSGAHGALRRFLGHEEYTGPKSARQWCSLGSGQMRCRRGPKSRRRTAMVEEAERCLTVQKQVVMQQLDSTDCSSYVCGLLGARGWTTERGGVGGGGGGGAHASREAVEVADEDKRALCMVTSGLTAGAGAGTGSNGVEVT